MDIMELIRTRKSVRTFDGNAVSEEDRKKLSEYIRTIDNHYGIPVKFVMLGAKKHGLYSPCDTWRAYLYYGKSTEG